MHVASNQDITAGMSEAKSNLKSEKNESDGGTKASKQLEATRCVIWEEKNGRMSERNYEKKERSKL